MGEEGSRGGAAGDGHERRRFDLEKTMRVDEASHLGDDARACDHHVEHRPVHDQVDVAPAVAFLDVLEAVPLIRQRLKRLGQHLEAGHRQREFARFGAKDRAARPDDVAALQLAKDLERLGAEIVEPYEELKAGRAVGEISEDHLTLTAHRHDAARERPLRRVLGRGPGGEVGVPDGEIRGVRRDLEARGRKWIDAAFAQRLQPRAPRADRVGSVRHAMRRARR